MSSPRRKSAGAAATAIATATTTTAAVSMSSVFVSDGSLGSRRGSYVTNQTTAIYSSGTASYSKQPQRQPPVLLTIPQEDVDDSSASDSDGAAFFDAEEPPVSTIGRSPLATHSSAVTSPKALNDSEMMPTRRGGNLSMDQVQRNLDIAAAKSAARLSSDFTGNTRLEYGNGDGGEHGQEHEEDEEAKFDSRLIMVRDQETGKQVSLAEAERRGGHLLDGNFDPVTARILERTGSNGPIASLHHGAIGAVTGGGSAAATALIGGAAYAVKKAVNITESAAEKTVRAAKRITSNKDKNLEIFYEGDPNTEYKNSFKAAIEQHHQSMHQNKPRRTASHRDKRSVRATTDAQSIQSVNVDDNARRNRAVSSGTRQQRTQPRDTFSIHSEVGTITAQPLVSSPTSSTAVTSTTGLGLISATLLDSNSNSNGNSNINSMIPMLQPHIVQRSGTQPNGRPYTAMASTPVNGDSPSVGVSAIMTPHSAISRPSTSHGPTTPHRQSLSIRPAETTSLLTRIFSTHKRHSIAESTLTTSVVGGIQSNDSNGSLPLASGVAGAAEPRINYLASKSKNKEGEKLFTRMYIAQDLIPPIASNHNSNESPVISPRASFIQQSGGGGNRERSHSIASNHSSPQNIQQQQQQPAPQTQSAPQQKNPIRALQFSQCGLFLASGGLDGVVRIWKVKGAQVPVNARGSHNRDTDTNSIASKSTRMTNFEKDIQLAAPIYNYSGNNNNNSGGGGGDINAEWDTPSRRRLWVFDPVPVREYRAHTASILCLTWSKNMFLLSSAMDNTVRLWHVSRNNCIWVFRHPDSVPSVSFHPMDDRFFLSGCLDGRIRLWNIAMHKTVKWNEMENGHLITAVNFIGKDGGIAAAGSERGICQLFKTDGLVYDTHLNVRSTRGKNSVGSKITGIEIMPSLKNNSNNNNSNLISGAASVISGITGHNLDSNNNNNGGGGNKRRESHFEDKILITTNDSRIRLYNMTDKTLERKYKGHSNTCRQIKASFSDDGKYIICGSDDFGIYIWDVEDGETASTHHSITTNHNNNNDAHSIYGDDQSVHVPQQQSQPKSSGFGIFGRKSKKPGYESIHPMKSPVNAAIFAPTHTRLHLMEMEDAGYHVPGIDAEGQPLAISVENAVQDGIIVVCADEQGIIRVLRRDVRPLAQIGNSKTTAVPVLSVSSTNIIQPTATTTHESLQPVKRGFSLGFFSGSNNANRSSAVSIKSAGSPQMQPTDNDPAHPLRHRQSKLTVPQQLSVEAQREIREKASRDSLRSGVISSPRTHDAAAVSSISGGDHSTANAQSQSTSLFGRIKMKMQRKPTLPASPTPMPDYTVPADVRSPSPLPPTMDAIASASPKASATSPSVLTQPPASTASEQPPQLQVSLDRVPTKLIPTMPLQDASQAQAQPPMTPTSVQSGAGTERRRKPRKSVPASAVASKEVPRRMSSPKPPAAQGHQRATSAEQDAPDLNQSASLLSIRASGALHSVTRLELINERFKSVEKARSQLDGNDGTSGTAVADASPTTAKQLRRGGSVRSTTTAAGQNRERRHTSAIPAAHSAEVTTSSTPVIDEQQQKQQQQQHAEQPAQSRLNRSKSAAVRRSGELNASSRVVETPDRKCIYCSGTRFKTYNVVDEAPHHHHPHPHSQPNEPAAAAEHGDALSTPASVAASFSGSLLRGIGYVANLGGAAVGAVIRNAAQGQLVGTGMESSGGNSQQHVPSSTLLVCMDCKRVHLD